MNNNLTIEQIINHIPEYKVIETGEILTPVYINYKDKYLYFVSRTFDFNQVQKMTPLSFNGERIGIGDTVNGLTVYDYYYNFNYQGWVVNATDDRLTLSHTYSSWGVESHTPLHPTKAKEVTMKEVEEKFGCKVKIIK